MENLKSKICAIHDQGLGNGQVNLTAILQELAIENAKSSSIMSGQRPDKIPLSWELDF